MKGLPLTLLIAGSLVLAYGLFGLYAGWIVSTWARIEYRPSVPYWITVGACLAIGIVNVVMGLKMLWR